MPEIIETTTTVQILPVTGIGDYTSPIENTRRFLFPAPQARNFVPAAMFWSFLGLTGMTIGSLLGKRKIL